MISELLIDWIFKVLSNICWGTFGQLSNKYLWKFKSPIIAYSSCFYLANNLLVIINI